MTSENQHLQTGYVKTAIRNNAAFIEFFHPQSNSLPGKLLAQLADAITEAGHNKGVHVIVLRAAGDKAFCAGASFTELIAIQNESEGLAFFSGFAQVINAMRKCPKFIIARVHGKCVGGGIGLAAAADYAIAVEGADIKLSELAIGIGPFVIGPAVERKTGVSAFSQLGINATQWQDAGWAHLKGLYAELHTTIESMDEAIDNLSGMLSRSNPEAMAAMKKMFWQGTEHWDDLLHERAATSGKLILSDFSRQAIEAFKSKGK
ncbi:MAG TPA: enoyl-CoA hydratase-related protein [Chitinophagaceae bacterium]|nr:enoyl-CoA hydratase-related protein [Chitinophagaceae bacterium]